MTPLYSIGHGRRSKEEFLALLKKYAIDFLIDVRSVPYSRFNPQYNQKALKSYLEENNIRYVFMGDELGGRPKDPLCYGNDGHIHYNSVMQMDFFKEGILRLKAAYDKNVRAAIMCSESKPEMCHRSRLIGNALLAGNIPLLHIDEKGELKTQDEVL